MRCQKYIDDPRAPSGLRQCRRPARYVFTGHAGGEVRVRAYCVLHSGKGLLSEGALPGWVEQVIDLRETPHVQA